MDIDIVTDPDEIKEIIPVIRSAWGLESMEQLIKDIVAAMRFHGGLVLLARDGEKILGMHYSFPGYRNGRVYLYSHMTGVLQQDKYRGVGQALKFAQREWARSHGYSLVAWTYDPLMALNANFNFNKLGVFSRTYLRNFYGSMEDSLNFGLPTDRFVAEWWNDYSRPKIQEPKEFVNSPSELTELHLAETGRIVGLHIPPDFVAMKREDKDLALKVRLALRSAFETLMASGYCVTGFDKNGSFYILAKNFQPAEKYGKNIFLD